MRTPAKMWFRVHGLRVEEIKVLFYVSEKERDNLYGNVLWFTFAKKMDNETRRSVKEAMRRNAVLFSQKTSYGTYLLKM